MKLYSITSWKEIFETSESRKLINLSWWAKPNKHDGLGFARLKQQRDKVELYCAWNLIGDVASKSSQKERGTLIRGGKPLTAEDLSLMTGFPQPIFERALDFFSRSDLGWLTVTEVGPEIAPNEPAATAQAEGAPDAQAASPAPVPGESAGVPGDSQGHRETDRQTDKEGKTDRESARARRSASSPRDPGEDAQIPTEAEFVAEFMVDGIPEDYLRHQFAKFEGNNEWLDRYGRLKKYQKLVRSYWSQDRAKWQTKRNHGAKKPYSPNI